MSNPPQVRKLLVKEAALFFGFLFLGLVLLPVAIYAVGENVFGDYGGNGYYQFYSDLSSRVRSGDTAAMFLVLSPYLGWQTLRLIALGWRKTRKQ